MSRHHPGRRLAGLASLAVLCLLLVLPLPRGQVTTIPWDSGELRVSPSTITVSLNQAVTLVEAATLLRSSSGEAFRLSHTTSGSATEHAFAVQNALGNGDYVLTFVALDADGASWPQTIRFRVNAPTTITLLEPLSKIAPGAPFDAVFGAPPQATCKFGLTPSAIIHPMETRSGSIRAIRNIGASGNAAIDGYIALHTEAEGAAADDFFVESALVYVECQRASGAPYPVLGIPLGVDATPPHETATPDQPVLSDIGHPRVALAIHSDDKVRCTLSGKKFCSAPDCTPQDCETDGTLQLEPSTPGAPVFDLAHACDFTRYKDLYPYTDDPADPDSTPELLEERIYDFTLACTNRAGLPTSTPFRLTVKYTEVTDLSWTHPTPCDTLPSSGQISFATNIDVLGCTLKHGAIERSLTPTGGRTFSVATSQLGTFGEGPQTLQHKCATAFNPNPAYRDYAFTVDRTAPTLDSLGAPERSSCNLEQFELSFAGSDAATGCGLDGYAIKVTRPGLPASDRVREFSSPTSPFIYSGLLSPAPPGLSPNELVQVEVRAKDRAGQLSAPKAAEFRIQDPETAACDQTRPIASFSTFPAFQRTDIRVTCSDLDWGALARPSGCKPTFSYCTTDAATCEPATRAPLTDVGSGLFEAWLQASETKTWCYNVEDNAGNAATGCEPVDVRTYPIHCFNNALDAAQGETDVDCGGPCPPCGARCGDHGEPRCPGRCPYQCGANQICTPQCEVRPDCEPRPDPDCTCGPGDDCPGGYDCVNGRCASRCGPDCDFNGYCGLPGAACTQDAQCTGGGRCQIGHDSTGRCTDAAAGQRRCDGLNCPLDADCPGGCGWNCERNDPPRCVLICGQLAPRCAQDPDCACIRTSDCPPGFTCQTGRCTPTAACRDCVDPTAAPTQALCERCAAAGCQLPQGCAGPYPCPYNCEANRRCIAECGTDRRCAAADPDCSCRSNSDCERGMVCQSNRCVPDPACPPDWLCGPGNGCDQRCFNDVHCRLDEDCPRPCTLNCFRGDNTCTRDCDANPDCAPDEDCECTFDADCRPPTYPNHRCDSGRCRRNPDPCPVSCSSEDGRCGGPQCRNPVTPPCTLDADCTCRRSCALDGDCDAQCTAANYCAADPDCAACSSTQQCRDRYQSQYWVCRNNRCEPAEGCTQPNCGDDGTCNNACGTAPCPADPDCRQICREQCAANTPPVCNPACTTPPCTRDPDCQCTADTDCRAPQFPDHHCDGGRCTPNPIVCRANCDPTDGQCRAPTQCGSGPCPADADCECRWNCSLDTYCDGNCTVPHFCGSDPDCAPCSSTPQCRDRYNSTGWICNQVSRCVPNPLCPLENCTAGNSCNLQCATTPMCANDTDCGPHCTLNCTNDWQFCNLLCGQTDGCPRDQDCCRSDADCAPPRFPNHQCDTASGTCVSNPPVCTANCSDTDTVCGGPQCHSPPTPPCDEDEQCVCRSNCSLDTYCDGNCTAARFCPADPDCAACSSTPQCRDRYNSTGWVCTNGRCTENPACTQPRCGPNDGCNPLCATAPNCRADPDCAPQCTLNCTVGDDSCNRACGTAPCPADTDCICQQDSDCRPPTYPNHHCDSGRCRPNATGGCAANCDDADGQCLAPAQCGQGTCPVDDDCTCPYGCAFDTVCDGNCTAANYCAADPDCAACSSTRDCTSRYNQTGWSCDSTTHRCRRPCPFTDCATGNGCNPLCAMTPGCSPDADCIPPICPHNCSANNLLCVRACESSDECPADADCNCYVDANCAYLGAGWRCLDGGICGPPSCERCVSGGGCASGCGAGSGCPGDPDCECRLTCVQDRTCNEACGGAPCGEDPDCRPCSRTSDCTNRYNETGWICSGGRCAQNPACPYNCTADPQGQCERRCEQDARCHADPDCRPMQTCQLNCTGDGQFCNQACGNSTFCLADPDCSCSANTPCPAGQHCDNGRCRNTTTTCTANCDDADDQCRAPAQCGSPPAGGCDTDTDCVCTKTCIFNRQCDPACTSEYYCPADPDCAACSSTSECVARYNSTAWHCDSALRRCVERPDCPLRDCGPGDTCNPLCATTANCLVDPDCAVQPCPLACGNDTLCIGQCDNTAGCRPDPNCRCTRTADCPGGLVCTAQRCVPAANCTLTCRLDGTCVTGCDGARCPADPDCGGPGACDLDCSRNDRCNSRCLNTIGCAADPDCQCAADADCPSGFRCRVPTCIPNEGCPNCDTNGNCTAGCDGSRCPFDEDCGASRCNYLCGADTNCVPECASSGSCPRDPDCQCAADADCAQGRCVRGRCLSGCAACAADGACTSSCPAGCPADPDCAACVYACGSDGLCNQECSRAGCAADPDCRCGPTAPCPPGFTCAQNNTCVPRSPCPPCRADLSCDARCDGASCPVDPDCAGDCGYLCGNDTQCIPACAASPGCGRDPDCACARTADCPAGMICQNNLCVPSDACRRCARDGTCSTGCDGTTCPSDPDCPGGCGFACGRDGQCRPECAASPGCVRDPDCSCARTADCPAGHVCENSACRPAPGCTRNCMLNGRCESGCNTADCPTDPDCGGACGYQCAANGGCNLNCTAPSCSADPDCACRATPDCPSGFTCQQGRCQPSANCPDCGTDTVCTPGCGGRCPADLDCPGGCVLDCASDGACLPDCDAAPCRTDPDCVCRTTLECPRGRICTGGRCVPAAGCPLCALDSRCDTACTGRACPVDPDCAGLCAYLCGADTQCITSCATSPACAQDPDCAQCQGASCTNCTGSTCTGCTGPLCAGCRGDGCPGCQGPGCATCRGADCANCTGPTCTTCTGADCPGCAGPRCTTCTGLDCDGCEAPGCTTCEGPDCEGFGCKTSADCETGVCKDGKCAPSQCVDRLKNGDETDIDCGGSCPTTCVLGKACLLDGDCASTYCNVSSPAAKRCALPSCKDRLANGDETDTDCGGTCPKCGLGKQCKSQADCAAGTCTGGLCKLAGKTCQAAQDCAAGEVCKDGTCQPKGCQSRADCAAGEACEAGRCVLLDEPGHPLRHAMGVTFLVLSLLLIGSGSGYLLWTHRHPRSSAPLEPAEPGHPVHPSEGASATPVLPKPARESPRLRLLREQAKRTRDDVRRKMRTSLFSHFDKDTGQAPPPQPGHIPPKPDKQVARPRRDTAAPSPPIAPTSPPPQRPASPVLPAPPNAQPITTRARQASPAPAPTPLPDPIPPGPAPSRARFAAPSTRPHPAAKMPGPTRSPAGPGQALPAPRGPELPASPAAAEPKAKKKKPGSIFDELDELNEGR